VVADPKLAARPSAKGFVVNHNRAVVVADPKLAARPSAKGLVLNHNRAVAVAVRP
jgi:urease gamma subunit